MMFFSQFLLFLIFSLPCSCQSYAVPQASGNSLDAKSCIILREPTTGCEVVLVGCCHGAASSADDVRACITPETSVIVLELCTSRFAELRRQSRESSVQMPRMRNTHARSLGGATANILGAVNAFQTTLSGLEPGLEFKTALDLAQQHKIDVVLADQAIEETLERVSQLPKVSIDLWRSFIQKGWNDSFGREASALSIAMTGGETRLSVGSFATRNSAAVRDALRLLLPPLFTLQAVLLVLEWIYTGSIVEATDFFHASGVDIDLSVLLANAVFLGFAYLSFALPAARVILRERDDCLTRGILQACQLAGPKGRVVAVLGLLHVNGIAQRLSQNKHV